VDVSTGLLHSWVTSELACPAAWIMDSDDQSEIAFLVPKNEGDFLCAVESTTIGHVVVTLTEILPDLKVSVAPDGDG